MFLKRVILERAIALVVLLCGVSQCSLLAKSLPLELRWSELASVVVSHHVELTLKGGGSVKGDAVSVREDTLVIDVSGSSGPKAYARGHGEIPRSDIALIKVQRSKGSWGRGIGTTLGILVGLGVGGNAAFHANSAAGGTAILVGTAGAVGVVGYYIGRSLDTHDVQITILP
jgi:hypothetical protein